MKPLPQQRTDEIHAMIKSEILKFSDRIMDEIRVMHEFGPKQKDALYDLFMQAQLRYRRET